MELKEFIKITLSELSEGITESEKELGKKIILTNTTLRRVSHGNYGLIEFDLAVEAKSSSSSNKKGGLQIKVLEANIGNENKEISGTVSRVKFIIQADF